MTQRPAQGTVMVLGSAVTDHLQRPVLLTPRLALLVLIVMMGAALLTGQAAATTVIDGGPLDVAGELH